MGGPAGVPEAHPSLQGLVAKQAVEVDELSDGATHREAIVVEDRHSRGIVAPVLEPAEALQQHLLGAALTADVADDSTHVYSFFGGLALPLGTRLLLRGSLLSPSAHPSLDVSLPGAGDGQGVAGHFLVDRRAGGDVGVVAQGHRRDQVDVAADEDALAHGGAVLGLAVVVHGDDAAAEGGAGPHVGVADVGEVSGLHALADVAVLHLDVVADLHAAPQVTAGAQVSSGPELDVVVELARLDHAVGLHVHPLAEPAGAGDHHARIDPRVAADLHVGVDVGGVGIHDGDALGHQSLGGAPAHDRGGPGQLGPAVHPECLFGVVQEQRLHGHALADRQRDDVGQVELALLVAVVELGQVLREQLRVEQIDSRVALLDGQLFRARVGHLDDPRHPPRGVADQAAGKGEARRQQHQIRPPLGLERPHPPYRLGAQQRGVSVQDQHLAGEPGEGGQGLLRGVARPATLALYDEVSAPAEALLDLLGVAPDHDHQVLRIQRLGDGERVAQHGTATDLVKDLVEVGAHPGALACGQDDDGELCARRFHECSSSARRTRQSSRSLGLCEDRGLPRGE